MRHATLVPARHYGLTDRGAVAPGYRADLVVVEDLRDFRPHLVLKDGQIVAREGQYLTEGPPSRLDTVNTVRLAPLAESAFRLPLREETCPIVQVVPDQIVTRREMQPVRRVEGCWSFDPGRDLVLIASIERHRATGRIGLGLVGGLGLRAGALGSSVAHDSHNLIVAGAERETCWPVSGRWPRAGVGSLSPWRGRFSARLPLPLAGLLSLDDADTVCHQLQEVNQAARALGCSLASPFGTLSFLALPVLPEIRITTRGLYDVLAQRFLPL